MVERVVAMTREHLTSTHLSAHAGCAEEYADFYMGPVHVEDVALAHILLYENPSASGRHLCVESIAHWSDFASKVAELYPNYKVPKYAICQTAHLHDDIII